MQAQTGKGTTVYGNYIDGKWQVNDDMFAVMNKYTGEELARVSKASKEDVEKAVTSALHTFHTKKLSPVERYEILMRAADIIKERREELALILVAEVGKVLKDARGEIDRGIQTLIASAEEAKRIAGQGVPLGQPGNENKMAFTVRVPVGVIGAITPFNFPFNLTVHKVGPALAAGNTIVLKPAEMTPIIAMKLAEILEEAGLPAGFLNVVNGFGPETGQYLLEDERIAMFTFTGSPGVGRHIKSTTGIRRVTLELGNNSPNIVHRDAPDLGKAAELCVTRGFSNAGQACISVQRVYVHRDVYDSFVEQAVKVAHSLKVGDPTDPATDVGPMISEKEAKRAEAWISEAIAQGAKAACGGKREGAVLYPTVLVDVTPEMKVVCQEVFAPVISIIPFDDIEDAFRQANDSRLGLQVGLFTANLQLAMRAVHELEFGGVIINDVSTYRADVMPYGGVKDSGIGKEGPRWAVEEMTEERVVVINLS
ncbi:MULTISPECIES: aldehyde dehydrogenase family protein [Brevibacillus]|jgi:acyl-CoA reductase-like NAD-dependent aldehyde dehydrogenase|uniref:aldehyde dehydrogenase family protein n=1 Tax=Brevibacillus TaxID=55080 RepID=UPI00046A46B6|nr:aldehyde dehydrogenase family protein [Brevibacillus borstelensis]KKX54267.1 aldehyde dehydrogenase [Brevibacillus borstelensis cifa_chp40]MBE5396519.1 aldehyde dehydrogenase family protein [Brevibacillus borstelensis]MCC0566407.1 aldehyde dehydrogenase family protein [Brevibacillus borstelensis]MCM3471769.1 aldehyde dehydrogenase family protein [Brevibacillus borstelensis]MCM3557561.1 aldehyde dehydrogenase family protein [Brevibacillus borstelensis]